MSQWHLCISLEINDDFSTMVIKYYFFTAEETSGYVHTHANTRHVHAFHTHVVHAHVAHAQVMHAHTIQAHTMQAYTMLSIFCM
jgi:hypothetical protein